MSNEKKPVIVCFGDLPGKEPGKTINQENLEKKHNIPIDA